MSQIINNFLGNILVAIGLFLFAKIVLNTQIKISKRRLIINFILSVISYTIIMECFEGTTKTFFMGITMILFERDIFKESYYKVILITFLYLLMLIIPEIFMLFFTTKILRMNKNFYYDVFAGSIIGNLVVQLLTIIISFFLRKILRKLINTKIINDKKIVFFLIATFVCVTLFFYIFAKEFRMDGNSIPYLIAIIVFVTILLSLIKQTITNYKLTNEYDKLLEFMTTYEKEIEKQRILRHEVKNEFRTIRAKICDNQENKEIIEYIDEILKEKSIVKQEKYAKFGYLPSNGIKGLCYFKVQEAEKNGINISLNISKKIKESTIYNLSIKQERDFGRILGVFLDNAIEASKESKKKQLGIEAYVNSNKEFKMIITNTYNNKIDKNKIGVESFSTKGKTRGHGLLLVKQLKEKNKKFEIKTDIQENLYIQTIEIKKI